MRELLAVDPLRPLAEQGGVLGVVTGVEGAAYRPVGAAMSFTPDGARCGAVSSGCLEDALALEAEEAAREGRPRQLRYGRGSPWFDIQLPCGAGLDITLWPCAVAEVLREASAAMEARRAAALHLPVQGFAGAALREAAPAGWSGETFVLPRIPPLRFLVFGTGIETIAFVSLARAAGYEALAASTDARVLAALPGAAQLRPDMAPAGVEADAQTAIVLFYHDHLLETPILQAALDGAAFWIGAQGSARAQAARMRALAEAGVPAPKLARMQDRIGLIQSARDPQTLVVSVLADVVAAYKARWIDPFFGARA